MAIAITKADQQIMKSHADGEPASDVIGKHTDKGTEKKIGTIVVIPVSLSQCTGLKILVTNGATDNATAKKLEVEIDQHNKLRRIGMINLEI